MAILADGPVYAHLRDASDGAPAVTVINAASEARTTTVTLPADLHLDHDRFVDVIEGEVVALGPGRTLTLDLPPLSALMLLPEGLDCGVSP